MCFSLQSPPQGLLNWINISTCAHPVVVEFPCLDADAALVADLDGVGRLVVRVDLGVGQPRRAVLAGRHHPRALSRVHAVVTHGDVPLAGRGKVDSIDSLISKNPARSTDSNPHIRHFTHAVEKGFLGEKQDTSCKRKGRQSRLSNRPTYLPPHPHLAHSLGSPVAFPPPHPLAGDDCRNF